MTKRTVLDRITRGAAMAFGFVVLLCPVVLAQAAPPKVLLLFSHDRLLPANIELEGGIREALGRLGVPVEIHAEFLDVVRFPGPDHAENMTRYLHDRHADRPPAAILTIGPHSLGFIATHRQKVFPQAPLVVAGFTDRELENARNLRRFAGRPMRWTIEPILREIPRCRPDIRRLHLVAGSAPFDRERLHDALEACAAVDHGLTITTSAGEDLATLQHALGQLDDDTLVVYLSYFRTPGGTTTVPRVVGSRLAASASVPLLGLFDSFLGDGITGICATSFHHEGVTAGELVSRILSGEPPASIELLEPATPRFVFDAKQLDRWGWDEDRLPPKSEIVNRSPGLWEQHRDMVIAGGAVLLVQSALIAGLVLARRRQQRTQGKLRRSEARFIGIFRGSPTAIAILRQKDGTIVEVNPAWEAMTGVARDDALGRTPLEQGFLISGDAEGRFAEFLEAGKPLREYEQPFCSPEGHTLSLSLTLNLVELQGETCYVVLAEDVTERREISENLRQISHASRLAQLGEMTASIAHEINQPLAAILSNTEAAEMLIARDEAPLGEVRKILSDIRHDDLRASKVIQRVRALLARREIRFEAIDLEGVIRGTARLITDETRHRGIEIDFQIEPGLPAVQGNQGQLEQAFLNLLFNAMDAMSETPVPRRKITIHATPDDPAHLRITVGDCGTGIAPADQARLFEAFSTTKEGGMGLGLSLVRSIVELHGGRITAENNASGGADFHLTLPVPSP